MTDTVAMDHDQAVAQLDQLLARRRVAQSRNVLARALPQWPDSIPLLQHSAWVDWLEDELDAALATINKILEIDPSSYNARMLLARIYNEQDKHAEAEETVIDVLKEYPEDPDPYALYAQIMLNTLNVDKAERLATEALKLDADNINAMYVHTICGFIKSSGDEQRERLRRMLQEHPDQMQASLGLVQFLATNGKVSEAYELARELVLADPENEPLAEMANELRIASHWSMKLMWPMQKWGWAGAIGIWIVAVALMRSTFLDGTPLEPAKPVIAVLFLLYVVYSWVWPPLLRRIMR